MNLFVLAAGYGTRFNPLTLRIPKPAIPFLNVPMGYYNFRFLKSIEPLINSFVVNTHHLPEQIETLYQNQKFIKPSATFSNEMPTILGTAGGIKFASNKFKKDEPIVVMNADEIIFTPNNDFLKDAVAQHERNNALATLVVMKHPEVGKKFGAILAENFSVKNIVKTITTEKEEAWHYIGIIILSWDVIGLIDGKTEQNIFYDILINKLDRVEIFPIDADWYETGNQIDYLKASNQVLTELEKRHVDIKYKNVHSFINQVDPSEVIKTKDGFSLISNSVKVDPANLTGFNVISKTAKISPVQKFHNAVLFDSEILT